VEKGDTDAIIINESTHDERVRESRDWHRVVIKSF
jgi:hypothetical protein